MTESIPTFDNPDNYPSNLDERPTLLKVLCILSWIGAGFQIIVSTLYSLFINDNII